MTIFDWIMVKLGIYKVTEIKFDKPVVIPPNSKFSFQVNIHTGEVRRIKTTSIKQTKESL